MMAEEDIVLVAPVDDYAPVSDFFSDYVPLLLTACPLFLCLFVCLFCTFVFDFIYLFIFNDEFLRIWL